MNTRVLFCALFCFFVVKTTKPTQYTWGGFVRLDTAFDTRQNVMADDCTINFYPQPIDYDTNCCDINAHSHFCMTPVVTRIFFKTFDTNIKNVALNSYLETDFTGINYRTASQLKIRHAYIQAEWQKTALLIGQYYHPIIAEECFTDTVGFGVGMPVALYARWPQIRLEHTWHELVFGATAYSQFLFKSPGPLGPETSYIRNSLVPALCLTGEWHHNTTHAGLLFNFKRLQPAIATSPPYDATKRYATQERITSLIGSVWLGCKIGHLRINNQCTIGQNGPDFSTLGGYAVSCHNPSTGHSTYTNINFMSVWSDIEYQHDQSLIPGLFIGIANNLGSQNPVYLDPTTHEPTFYGFDTHLDKVMRFMPRITTLFHSVYLGLEFDYARAWFGPMNCQGKHPKTTAVDSARTLLVIRYEY